MLCCAACLAQQYPFVYYTPRDGLVNSRVRGIKQDSRGRMYFITYGGLSVYNGAAFKNYSQQDGLANTLVNDVLEISPDSFLVATNAPALNTLVRGKILNYITSDNFCPVINRFLKSNDGDVYFLTDDGLFVLTGNKFTRLPLIDTQGVEIGYNLNDVTEWGHFLLIIPWSVSQKEKLIVYDKKKRIVVGTITDKLIRSTAITPKGELWVSSIDGIELLDEATLQKGTLLLKPLSEDESFKRWKNAYLYIDYHGDTWIYYHNEVLFVPDSGKIQMLTAHQGLKTNNLSDIFLDREGNTWMASDGNGIVKMPGNNIQISGELIHGIGNHITAIHHVSDTTWLFNITDNSFYRIHNNQLTVFPLGLTSTNVSNIYIDCEVLYYTTDHEIFRIGNKDQTTYYRRPVQILQEELSDVGEISMGVIDSNGVILQGVGRKDDTFYLVAIHNGKVLMREKLSFKIDQLALYQDAYLWVATRDNQLKAYSLHPESLSKYLQLRYDYSDKIQGIEPRSLTVDTTGNVWIGTRNNGIYRLQMEDNISEPLLQITTQHGLTDNFLLYLHCDTDNNIWAGSWTGLDKIILKNSEILIENITKNKNLFLGISRIASVENDKIWALTSTGDVIMISPSLANSMTPIPSLFITSMVVNDSVYDESETSFSHDLNNLTISVAAPSFIDEKSTRYSYWLEGSSKTQWSEPSNHALFNFINLSPGSYQLHIKAEFSGHLYPDQQLNYAFTILPPYWLTWWFLTLASLLVLGLLGLIVRYYYARKLEKQTAFLERKRAIEKERTRIATDMHDDLGAGLSRIKFLSDTIGIKKQQQLPIEEEIANIGHYAHDMIDKMGEIVWALNEKNDSLSDLLSYTRAYSVEYLAENGLHGIIEKIPQPGNITVSGEFRRNMFLSVKETLHNIIKHAKANEVKIRFVVTDRLTISIQDDGIGFDPQNTRLLGNGLINIKQRMFDISGEVQITNNHGTRIILTAPLPS